MAGRLRADFRRFYGLPFPPPDMGLREVADLVAYLPRESVTVRTLQPEGDADLQFLRSIEYSLRWLQWAKTKDGSKNRAAPEPLRFEWEKEEPTADVMSWDDAASFLGWEAEMAKWFNN